METLSIDLVHLLFQKLSRTSKLNLTITNKVHHDLFPFAVLPYVYVRDGTKYLEKDYLNHITKLKCHHIPEKYPPNVIDIIYENINSKNFDWPEELASKLHRLRIGIYSNSLDQWGQQFTSLRSLIINCNELIQPIKSLPQTLTHLELTAQVQIQYLPPHLTHLALYNIIDLECSIPSSITYLTVYYDYGVLADIPSNVVHLETNLINETNIDHLPANLHTLQVTICPLELINKLPRNLIRLNLGTNDHNINFTPVLWPSRLQSLYLTAHEQAFNIKLSELPQTLTRLNLTNVSIDPSSITQWPPSITSFDTSSSEFNYSIDSVNFPSAMRCVSFGTGFNKPICQLLPPNLTHLKLGDSFGKHTCCLPKNLTHLVLSTYFGDTLYNLPESLIYLSLTDRYDTNLINLPSKLEYLVIGNKYQQLINHLPDSIKFIRFTGPYQRPISKFPANLRVICFSETYTHPIPKHIRVYTKINWNLRTTSFDSFEQLYCPELTLFPRN